MDEEFLMISGIQHFIFCRRQWALIHVEQLWNDNLRTIEGEIIHEKCHEEAYLALENENVIVKTDDKTLGRVPLLNLENILYFGYKGASPLLMGECAKRKIGLCFLFNERIKSGVRGPICINNDK